MKSAASPAWPAKRMTKVLADLGRFGGVEGGVLAIGIAIVPVS